jgi:hypothetical protein
VASGALARIEDPDLKARIKRTYSFLKNNVRVASARNASLAERASQVIMDNVPFVSDPDNIFFISVAPEFDFQLICNDLELNNAMLDLLYATRNRHRMNSGSLQMLRETEEMLAAHLEPAP